MNFHDKLVKLKYSLQALAQPADAQLKLFPDFVQVADELALDFEHWYSVVSRSGFDLTLVQKDSLKHLNALFSEMSKQTFKDRLWTESGLRNSTEWESVRDSARRILEEFDWELTEPPIDRNLYVRSSNRK